MITSNHHSAQISTNLHHHSSQERRETNGVDKVPLRFWSTGYLDVTKTKEKQLLHVSLI